MQAMALSHFAAEQSLKKTRTRFHRNPADVRFSGRERICSRASTSSASSRTRFPDLTGDLKRSGWTSRRHGAGTGPISTEAASPLLSLAEYRDLGINQNPKSRPQWRLPRKRARCANREGGLYSRCRRLRAVTRIRTVCHSWFTIMARSVCG